MLEEAGLEAVGLRGAYLPKCGGLLLARDATKSRDAVVVVQAMIVSLLRRCERKPPKVIIVAAHASPAAHFGAICRLGASPALVREHVVIVDAQSEGERTVGDKLSSSPSGVMASKVKVTVAETAPVLLEAIQVEINSRLGRVNGREQSGNETARPQVFLFVDSSEALQLGIDCDVDYVIRHVLCQGIALTVCTDVDEPKGVDALDSADIQTEHVAELADTIIDLAPLSTAAEFHGRVRVRKVDGRWQRVSKSERDAFPSFVYRCDAANIRYFR